MKFKFCSDGDCPLWALSGFNAVSALPPEVLKEVLLVMMDDDIEDDAIFEVMKDTKMSHRDDCARVVGVLRWALKSTWRSKCEGSQLTRDLLVLGVPRAHATVMAEAADRGRKKYEDHVKRNPFMVNKVSQIKIEETPDTVLNSVTLKISLTDSFTGERRDDEVFLNKDQIPDLLKDLKRVYASMKDL